jgi:SAM-dependent methyltransferase
VRVEHLLRATAIAEEQHFWFRGFRAFVAPLIQHAVGNRPNPRILDCGCGTGANLEMLGRFGNAFGFDLSAVGLRIGRQAGRTRLTRASVAAAPFPGGIFDLVTSFDVLYALREPDARAAVTEMFRLTRPGGYALINVAAMEMLRGNHSVLSRELRRYDRSGLEQLVRTAGFTVVRLTYTNFTLFLPLAVLRMAQRWRGLASQEEATSEITVPPAPLNALLTAVLWLESTWVRRFDCPVGSSLMCLARKPADLPDAART